MWKSLTALSTSFWMSRIPFHKTPSSFFLSLPFPFSPSSFQVSRISSKRELPSMNPKIKKFLPIQPYSTTTSSSDPLKGREGMGSESEPKISTSAPVPPLSGSVETRLPLDVNSSSSTQATIPPSSSISDFIPQWTGEIDPLTLDREYLIFEKRRGILNFLKALSEKQGMKKVPNGFRDLDDPEVFGWEEPADFFTDLGSFLLRPEQSPHMRPLWNLLSRYLKTIKDGLCLSSL